MRNKKQQLGEGVVKMIHAKDAGEKFKPGRKDGGIATKPVVPCPDISEREVLKGCISWLKRHRVGAKRLNNGMFDTGCGPRQYGIKGAGDIQCIHRGVHIEIEVKRGRGGVLSLNQQKHRDWVLLHGGIYMVVHGVEELEYYMLPILRNL
jgi:hypothetical protein